jgi:glycerol-3-phosphate dehydrogenase
VQDYPFLTPFWAQRLIRGYGKDAWPLLSGAACEADLGQSFGASLSEREVIWLMDREYALTAQDVVWRRTKLGLRLSAEQIGQLDQFMARREGAAPISALSVQ